MPKPVAFMVMPFGEKPVGLTDPNVPAKVDFDALWDKVYQPALEQIGYEAVRADRDVGALIINDMIQRLTIADLVLADVTLPNANVYYEVGVRHAAQQRGCVLVAADWAKPTFDLAQMRQLRFALPDGAVPSTDAERARSMLAEGLIPLREGTSPVFDAVPGYPSNIDASITSAFLSAVNELTSFDADVRAVRLLPAQQRPAKARELVTQYGHQPAVRDAVALRLLRLIRDTACDTDDWTFQLDYIASLPTHLATHPLVLEQRAFALGQKGELAAAAAALEQLIKDHGGTSERYGLLGGRYKKLMRSASSSELRRHLSKAIDSYEKGMQLDLNDYYPASNLPRLYRERGREDDLTRAGEVAVITTEGCRRALALGLEDEWTKATLLGMAFYRGDVTDAQQLTERVEEEGPGAWQVKTTLDDLADDLRQHDDPQVRARLQGLLDRLNTLSSPPTV